MDDRNRQLTPREFFTEIYVLISLVVTVASIILSKTSLLLAIPSGVLCYFLQIFFLANMECRKNRFTLVMFAPSAFMCLHFWLLYLLGSIGHFWQAVQKSYLFFIFCTLVADFLFFKLLPRPDIPVSSANPEDGEVPENQIIPDPYLPDATSLVIEKQRVSHGLLQRMFKIDHARADSILNQLSEQGVVRFDSNANSWIVLKSNKQETDISSHVNKDNLVSVKESDISFDNMSGRDFELFCSDLLKRNFYSSVEVTKASGDHGVDILAEKDGITYAIQCKCYSSNIGNSAVQQALAGKSLYHRDIAVVLTNRYFTAQAISEAEQLNVKLWDRDKLLSLINTCI